MGSSTTIILTLGRDFPAGQKVAEYWVISASWINAQSECTKENTVITIEGSRLEVIDMIMGEEASCKGLSPFA